jgi:hypothetical protein
VPPDPCESTVPCYRHLYRELNPFLVSVHSFKAENLAYASFAVCISRCMSANLKSNTNLTVTEVTDNWLLTITGSESYKNVNEFPEALTTATMQISSSSMLSGGGGLYSRFVWWFTVLLANPNHPFVKGINSLIIFFLFQQALAAPPVVSRLVTTKFQCLQIIYTYRIFTYNKILCKSNLKMFFPFIRNQFEFHR